eukprot:gene30692-35719_t
MIIGTLVKGSFVKETKARPTLGVGYLDDWVPQTYASPTPCLGHTRIHKDLYPEIPRASAEGNLDHNYGNMVNDTQRNGTGAQSGRDSARVCDAGPQAATGWCRAGVSNSVVASSNCLSSARRVSFFREGHKRFERAQLVTCPNMLSAMCPQPFGKMSLQRASTVSSARLVAPTLCPARPSAKACSSRLLSSSAASTSQPTVCSGDAALPRYQAKKLASLFKSHRKQLERIQSAVMNSTEVSLAPSWDLTSDLNALRNRLAHLGDDAGSRSDSDSDEEDETLISSRNLAPNLAASITANTANVLDIPVSPRNYQEAGMVMVCQGRKCQHSAEVLHAVSTLAFNSGVEVKAVKCVGSCSSGGCAMRVKVAGGASAVYDGFGAASVATILDSHFSPAAAEPEPAMLNPLEAILAVASKSVSSHSSMSEDDCWPNCMAF